MLNDGIDIDIIDGYDDETMEGIPLGNDNFKEIRENGDYFVDKTGFIMEIVAKRSTKAFLFTRPRRFGKSLNLNMLNAFFNIEYRDKDPGWFNGLKVESDPKSMALKNSYPVILIDLKGLNTDSMEEFLNSFAAKIRVVFSSKKYLLVSDLDDVDLMDFNRIRRREGNRSELEMSLKLLTDLLYEYHGKKVIILIDEYDNAVNSSCGKDTHSDILSFMTNLLGNVLKGNESLQFGVVTGVMQIAKESLFSGLNNLYVNSIFSRKFEDRFGFTENEVSDMLSHYEHLEKLEEVREWYDGYRFGDADIYNPWSILSYLDNDFRAGTYWVNEGNPEIILESVRLNGPRAVRMLSDLYNDGIIKARINESMIFTDLNSMEGLLTLLTGSGYLKAVPAGEDLWELMLVNKEVKRGLLNQLATYQCKDLSMNEISRALLEGYPEVVRAELMKSLGSTVDSKLTRDERYYQAFMLGLLNCLTPQYYIRSEYRGGNGYADIAIIPRDGKGTSAVVELKDGDLSTGDDTMQNMA